MPQKDDNKPLVSLNLYSIYWLIEIPYYTNTPKKIQIYMEKKYYLLIFMQMLADLLFRRNEYDTAMYHFQQLLQKKSGLYKIC